MSNKEYIYKHSQDEDGICRIRIEEELIRCKDCKYYKRMPGMNLNGCAIEAERFYMYRKEMDYCSRGKRMYA